VFIIGGASLYNEALTLAAVDRILLTRILSPAYDECDVYFPDFLANDNSWRRCSHGELEQWAGVKVPETIQEELGTSYEFQMWVR